MISKRCKKIARKLNAETKRGSKHLRVNIRCKGKLVATYGISHSSRDKGHNYIPRQLHLTKMQTLDLAKCTLDKDEYFNTLREKGLLK